MFRELLNASKLREGWWSMMSTKVWWLNLLRELLLSLFLLLTSLVRGPTSFKCFVKHRLFKKKFPSCKKFYGVEEKRRRKKNNNNNKTNSLFSFVQLVEIFSSSLILMKATITNSITMFSTQRRKWYFQEWRSTHFREIYIFLWSTDSFVNAL